MALTWTDDLAAVDWQELSDLYRAAPLGDKSPADLQAVFSNSMFRAFVFDAGRLVGAGRVLADGRDCAYLCDIALLPDHAGQGIGRALVERLLEKSRGHRKIILYSVPGRQGFYESFGFRRMTTAMAIFEDQPRAFARGYLQNP